MTATRLLAGGRVVVVGGAGAVGGMFAELLLDAGADVCIVDARSPSVEGCSYERGDVTAFGPPVERELRRADVVLLALPEDVALAAIADVACLLAPGALLADTLSVKTRIVALLEEHAGHLEALSLNPMFAPSLGLAGRAVAAVVVQGGPLTRELLQALRAGGGEVVEIGAQRHDELTSVTQALTHAAVLSFGLALGDLDVDAAELAQLAPPPYVALLAMVARISSGQPATYRDVQTANPHAPRARAALADAVRRLADVIDHGDDAQFRDVLARIDDTLGDDAGHYAALCAELFQVARPPDATGRGAPLATSTDIRSKGSTA